MASDNSQVVIMNMALGHLNKRAITSPTQACEEARKMTLYYHRARRSALRACDWNFSTKNQSLALLGSVADADFDATWATVQDVIPGYSYLYAQPSLCLRVRSVYNPVTMGYQGSQGPFFDGSGNPVESVPASMYRTRDGDGDIRFEVLRAPKSDVISIATDLQSAWTKFTADITDETQFDDMFVDAFAFQLALLGAPSLTADEDTVKRVAAEFKEFMGEAKRKNGGEGTERLPRASAYEQARQ